MTVLEVGIKAIISLLNESEASLVYFQTEVNAQCIARQGWFNEVSHLHFYTVAMTLYEVQISSAARERCSSVAHSAGRGGNTLTQNSVGHV